MILQAIVTCAALGAGTVCFGLYVFQTIKAAQTKPPDNLVATAKGLDSKTLSVDEITKLVEAITGLTGSLVQAGPALTSLIGAFIFYAIAAVSGGALRG